MAKDPAVLWYFNDWMGGTATLSRHLKGCYIDLLSVQFNSGPMSQEEIKIVLGSDFGSSWPALQKKFKCENGLYFNERLQFEKEKRSKYSASRSKNRNTYVEHMENRNENVNKKYYGEFHNVFLTDEEFEKLSDRLGIPSTKILITELDGYIQSKGKDKYKDHYATILGWARRRTLDTAQKKILQTKTRTIA